MPTAEASLPSYYPPSSCLPFPASNDVGSDLGTNNISCAKLTWINLALRRRYRRPQQANGRLRIFRAINLMPCTFQTQKCVQFLFPSMLPRTEDSAGWGNAISIIFQPDFENRQYSSSFPPPLVRRRRQGQRGHLPGDGSNSGARHFPLLASFWHLCFKILGHTVICGYSDTFLTGLNCSRT